MGRLVTHPQRGGVVAGSISGAPVVPSRATKSRASTPAASARVRSARPRQGDPGAQPPLAGVGSPGRPVPRSCPGRGHPGAHRVRCAPDDLDSLRRLATSPSSPCWRSTHRGSSARPPTRTRPPDSTRRSARTHSRPHPGSTDADLVDRPTLAPWLCHSESRRAALAARPLVRVRHERRTSPVERRPVSGCSFRSSCTGYPPLSRLRDRLALSIDRPISMRHIAHVAAYQSLHPSRMGSLFD